MDVKTQHDTWANPNTTRSRVVLEIASELVGRDQPLNQARVSLRESGKKDWPMSLLASNTTEGVDAVAAGETVLAIVNPTTALSLAYRGSPPFSAPQPVRTLAVLPSQDQYVFAVAGSTGLRTFEDIGKRRYPLKITTRGNPAHSLHFMLAGVAQAAGFSLDDLRAWGGEIRKEGGLPEVDGPKFDALRRGEVDAIFEEGADGWVQDALDAGMTILPLAESTMQQLEALGYRRAIIEQRRFRGLPGDVLTVDFSGWPIFVRADLDDQLVAWMCEALEARKHNIPWQGEGPLPVERMCRDSGQTPMDVPLHPGAERYWRSRGYC